MLTLRFNILKCKLDSQTLTSSLRHKTIKKKNQHLCKFMHVPLSSQCLGCSSLGFLSLIATACSSVSLLGLAGWIGTSVLIRCVKSKKIIQVMNQGDSCNGAFQYV